jgi:hypothetical protein
MTSLLTAGLEACRFPSMKNIEDMTRAEMADELGLTEREASWMTLASLRWELVAHRRWIEEAA